MNTRVLTIPSVQVNGGATYTNVTLLGDSNYHFALLGGTAAPITGAPLATYAGGDSAHPDLGDPECFPVQRHQRRLLVARQPDSKKIGAPFT